MSKNIKLFTSCSVAVKEGAWPNRVGKEWARRVEIGAEASPMGEGLFFFVALPGDRA